MRGILTPSPQNSVGSAPHRAGSHPPGRPEPDRPSRPPGCGKLPRARDSGSFIRARTNRCWPPPSRPAVPQPLTGYDKCLQETTHGANLRFLSSLERTAAAPSSAPEPTPRPSPEPVGVEELGRLAEALRPRLLRLVDYYGVPARDAEDLLQETFLLAMAKLPDIWNLPAWLTATLRNRCLMYWRSAAGSGRRHVLVDSGSLALLAGADGPSPEVRAALADVRRHLAGLTPRRRGLLVHRAVFRESLEQVALRFGYRPSSISKVVARLRKRLVEDLSEGVAPPGVENRSPGAPGRPVPSGRGLPAATKPGPGPTSPR